MDSLLNQIPKANKKFQFRSLKILPEPCFPLYWMIRRHTNTLKEPKRNGSEELQVSKDANRSGYEFKIESRLILWRSSNCFFLRRGLERYRYGGRWTTG